jgi:glutaminase
MSIDAPTAAPGVRPPIAEELHQIFQAIADIGDGSLATYIPQLGKADPSWFGISVATVDGAVHSVGDAQIPFTIQSISKPFAYALALEDHGRGHVLSKVGVEPTGDAFNSIMIDEASRRPFNPMVNAGAIVTTGLVAGADEDERLRRLRDFLSAFAGRDLDIDEDVFRSERSTGDRNRAITYLMRAFDMVDRVDEVLDLYFRQCSLLVNCSDLAVMAGTLANGGVNPVTGVRAFSEQYVENVLSVMSTCGMYDFAGEWLYTVGLPAKSGVAGGIIAVLPGQLGVGVFSPLLDERGNSVRGVAVCQELSRRFHLHQYRPGLVSTDAISRRLKGGVMRSRRSRARAEAEVLEREGAGIGVYELRGDLIFGSAERLVREVTAEIGDREWIILDFRRVTSVDLVAWRLIGGFAERASQEGVRVIATYAEGAPAGLETAPDTDEALQRCEDELLMRRLGERAEPTVPLMEQPLLFGLGPPEAVAAIVAATTSLRFAPGEVVFCEGDRADAVYFVASGSLRAQIDVQGGRTVRLQTMGPGTAFGEMAFLDQGPRSAGVVAEEASLVHVLPFEALRRVEQEHSGVTQAFYRNLGQLLAARLRRATRQIQALDR